MSIETIKRNIPDAQDIRKTAESVSFRIARLNSREMAALVELNFWFEITPDVLDNGKPGILVVISR